MACEIPDPPSISSDFDTSTIPHTTVAAGTGPAATAAAYTAQVQSIVACNYLENYYKPNNTWQQALAGLIGAYSIVRQYQIMKEYLNLAKKQVEQADRMTVLAEKNYEEIAKKAFDCNKMLFDRYKDQFADYERRYLLDAFKDDCYTPDYALQRGRAIAPVHAAFDAAAKMRSRSRGKYNAGRACHDATFFAIEMAKTRVAAADHAYRFEEERQWRFTQWYWQRKTQGIGYVGDMASKVITGVNGGANVAMAGFGNISAALDSRSRAIAGLDAPFSNLGNFYGGIAQQAFNYIGYQQGRQMASPFGQSYIGYQQGGVPYQQPALPTLSQPSYPQWSPPVQGQPYLIDTNMTTDGPVRG